MESHEDFLRELREIAPGLAALDKTNPYKLPDGYFSNFAHVMLEKVKMADAKAELKAVAPELAKLGKLTETAIPADYFTTFSSGLLNKVRASEIANELAEIAPMLSSLQKVNLYQAPANYFNALPAQMAKAVKAEQKEPAISMPPVLQSINAVLERFVSVVFKPRYAFALSGFATILIIAVMMMTKIEECGDLDCKFAALTNEDLDAYFNNNRDEFGKSVLDVSTDDKKLLKQNAAGELNFDEYVSQHLSDEELNDALLD